MHVADAPHLLGGVLHVDERRDQAVLLRLRDHLLGDDADEEHLHPADLQNLVRLEEVRAVDADKEVCVDDGELRALLQKQQVREAVIDLMVSDRHHIGRKHVHDLDGGDALELLVDDVAAEHVPRDAVERVRLLLPHFVHIAGEQ